MIWIRGLCVAMAILIMVMIAMASFEVFRKDKDIASGVISLLCALTAVTLPWAVFE